METQPSCAQRCSLNHLPALQFCLSAEWGGTGELFLSLPSHEAFRADKQAPKPFCQPALSETEAWKQFYLSLLGLRPPLNKHWHQSLFVPEAEQTLHLISYHLNFSEFRIPSKILLYSAKTLDSSMLHLHESERQCSPFPTPPRETGLILAFLQEKWGAAVETGSHRSTKFWLGFLHIPAEMITEP